MLDPITIGLIGGAGLGLLGNAQKKKQQQMSANIRAAEIEASPWTGNAPSTQLQYAPSQWADLAQGGLGGAQLGSGLEAASADKAMKADWLTYLKGQQGGQAPTMMGSSDGMQFGGLGANLKY